MSKPKSKEYTIPLVRVQLVRDSGVAASVNKIMSPRDTFEIARQRLEFSDREVFLVIHVATDMAVISIEAAHVGTLDTGITSPREIFKGAILANAAALDERDALRASLRVLLDWCERMQIDGKHLIGSICKEADDAQFRAAIKQAREALG